MPNELELARHYGVSVGTVRKALEILEDEKLIVRLQGRGTFVCDQSAKEFVGRFSSIRDTGGARISGNFLQTAGPAPLRRGRAGNKVEQTQTGKRCSSWWRDRELRGALAAAYPC